MRGRLAVFAALMVAGMLGYVQVVSMSFYGDLARAPAIPAFVPRDLGPKLAWPLSLAAAPRHLREAYAQAELHAGDIRAASAIVAALPNDRRAADLRGQLAQAVGMLSSALENYARAGDLERAQGLIDARVAAGDLVAGSRFEQQLVEVLTGDERAAVRARALWRLGQITQLRAPGDGAHRLEDERNALRFYERSLMIAPNEETYLLAAGEQALVLGDHGLARRYYLRALDAVPDSAAARSGLLSAGP